MLKGENVLLRPLEPEDLDFLYQHENNTEIWRISSTTTPFSRQTLKKYINSIQDIYSDRQLRLLICDLSNSKNPIGMIDIFDFDPHNERAGVGIWITDESKKRSGIATESLKLVIRYAFEKLHLHQLYCDILESNEISVKLFQNHGFRQSGVKREWVKHNQKWENELMFQLIKEVK